MAAQEGVAALTAGRWEGPAIDTAAGGAVTLASTMDGCRLLESRDTLPPEAPTELQILSGWLFVQVEKLEVVEEELENLEVKEFHQKGMRYLYFCTNKNVFTPLANTLGLWGTEVRVYTPKVKEMLTAG